jgi:hypothetical protein
VTIKFRCQIPPVDLCVDHLSGHFGKSPEAPHLMVPILPGDLPDEPEDPNRGILKRSVQSVLRKCGHLKSDAIRYIGDREGMYSRRD